MKKASLAAIAALASTSAWAVVGTLSTGTDTKTGDIRWQTRSKSYEISFKINGKDATTVVKQDDVASMDIAKPAGFDRLVEMVKSGQGASAVQGLTTVVKDYKMLKWDKPAARYLVLALTSAGKAQQAYDIAQGLIAEDRTAAYTGELAYSYWQVLLKLGKTTQLENCLRMAASTGDRATSAEALIMRGDVILSETGDTPEGHRRALIDAYLRVAFMYSDCVDQRRLALGKAAESLDKIGMAAAADKMRTTAKDL